MRRAECPERVRKRTLAVALASGWGGAKKHRSGVPKCDHPARDHAATFLITLTVLDQCALSGPAMVCTSRLIVTVRRPARRTSCRLVWGDYSAMKMLLLAG